MELALCREKLERFAESFSFVEEDSSIFHDFISSLLEDNQDKKMDYSELLSQLKRKIHNHILIQYQTDRGSLFERFFEQVISDKKLSHFKKSCIFSSFLKAISQDMDMDFFRLCYQSNVAFSHFLKSCLLVDQEGLWINEEMVSSNFSWLPILKDYMQSLPKKEYAFCKKKSITENGFYQEDIALLKRIKNQEKDALSLFVENKQKWIWKIARRYCRYSGYDVSIDDLVQEGNIGLLIAIDHFQPEQGTAFSTYALHWIYRYIDRYVGNYKKTIRIPLTKQESLQATSRAIKLAESRAGRFLSPVEIEEMTGLERKKLDEYFIFSAPITSLNQIFPYGDSTVELETLIPDTCDLPDSFTSHWEEILDIIKGQLNAREYDIFCARVLRKVLGQKPVGLHELGNTYQCSYENIRLIEKKALLKLRSCLQLIETRDNIFSLERKLIDTFQDHPSLLVYVEYRLGLYDGIKKNHVRAARLAGISPQLASQFQEIAVSRLKEDEELAEFSSEIQNDGTIIRKRKARSFADVLKEKYSQLEPALIFSFLTDQEREILQLRYGKDYKQVISSSPSIAYQANHILYSDLPKRLQRQGYWAPPLKKEETKLVKRKVQDN